MATPAAHLTLIAPPRRMRRFAVMFRDEDTAKPQTLVVCAYTASEASDIMAGVLGHTNFELMEI